MSREPEIINLKSLSAQALMELVEDWGLPAFRGRQLLHWMYERGAVDLSEITEFSKGLREELSGKARIGTLELKGEARSQEDGTRKFLFLTDDGLGIETVSIPDEDRLTVCVSSQAGCAMGCGFCFTGAGGFRRNLLAHEIVEQVLLVRKYVLPEPVTNIVLMGMGEPLMNLDETAEALWRMTGLLGISKRRITLSTVGVVPAMRELPEKAPAVNLAVSLNATVDETRSEIMPINRRYPLAELMSACRDFPLAPRRRITFEYVMLKGVNDTQADARRLVRLLHGIPSKVNLIPFNEHPGSPYARPSDETVLAFQEELLDRGLTAPIRKSKGRDVMAACGMLGVRGGREEKKAEEGPAGAAPYAEGRRPAAG